MVKSVILLGDGMADYPIDSLSGKTPLEVAHSPNMDLIARSGTLGLFQSIPPGMPPGSDVATLSILGYDPQECYSGRGPLESASMGIKLGATDIAFRCNLVTFSKEAPRVMDDFTAGHIKSDEAAAIIGSLQQHFAQSSFSFYPGVGYRHLCVWHGGIASLKTTPPHDITGREIACYLPQGDGAETLLTLMHESRELL
ncbi:MAG: phosphoglycerate mutase, partial [Deltaproteobacteria bacterium]|nr:phosphoglycerate mutase [Deltaproteobacteria bacterium]